MRSSAIVGTHRLPGTLGEAPAVQRLAARARAPFQAALLNVIRDAALPPPLHAMRHIATALAHCVRDTHLRQYWLAFNELLAALAHQERPLDVDTKLMLSRADRVIKQLLEQGETRDGSAMAATELAALRRRIAAASGAVKDHTPLLDNIGHAQPHHEVDGRVTHQPVTAAGNNTSPHREPSRAEAALPEDLGAMANEITAYRARLERKIDTLARGLRALDQTIRQLHDQLRQLERDIAVRPNGSRQAGRNATTDRHRGEGVLHGNGARIYDA